MDDTEIQRRLADLGIDLPEPTAPVAAYIPLRVAGTTAFVAGQVPIVDGTVIHPGRLGDPARHITVEEGAEAARRAALQSLSVLRHELGGFARLRRILQVTVYIAASEDFVEHPKVANGASELLIEVLGDEGRHARAAVGVASLPLGASVEVAMTAEVEPA